MQGETPEEFVRQLKFKHKFFGGCAEEEVLLKIRELCDIYKKQTESLQGRLSREEQRSSELEQQVQAISQEKESALQKACQSEEAYADKVQQLDHLMHSIESSKQDILQKVKGDAIQEAEKLQKESQALLRQKEVLTEEIKSSSYVLDTELGRIQTVVESLRKSAGKLSEPYAVETK